MFRDRKATMNYDSSGNVPFDMEIPFRPKKSVDQKIQLSHVPTFDFLKAKVQFDELSS